MTIKLHLTKKPGPSTQREESRISAPRISILCPILNVRPYIGEMIESVLAQSYSRWELIIMDGKSSDGTIDVIRAYAKRDGRIRSYSEPDESPWHAVDKMLDLARGEFITIVCGQDGFLDKEWLQKCIEVFDRDKDVALVWALAKGMTENAAPLNEKDAYSPFIEKRTFVDVAVSLFKKAFRTGRDLVFGSSERRRFLIGKLFSRNATLVLSIFTQRSFPNGKVPQKEDWFVYWLKTGLVFPDQSMCVSKRVFLGCIPRYEMGSKTLGYMTEFFFNFNSRGYLAYFIPTYAIFTRIHSGNSGERAQAELEKKAGAYFGWVRNFRTRLIKERRLFSFLNRDGEPVSTRAF